MLLSVCSRSQQSFNDFGLIVGNQPEAVCESTFRRACTALLTFPAYFRQNASTAFIRRRFSVVT